MSKLAEDDEKVGDAAESIAKKIYYLRSEQKVLNEQEKKEVTKLREITDKIDGICKFKIVSTNKTDWKAVSEALFMKYNVGTADVEALTSTFTKETTYES